MADPVNHMNRELARKNVRTGLILAFISILMAGLTVLVAELYVH